MNDRDVGMYTPQGDGYYMLDPTDSDIEQVSGDEGDDGDDLFGDGPEWSLMETPRMFLGLPNEEVEEDWLCSRGAEISQTHGHMCYSKTYPSPIEPVSYSYELPLTRRFTQENDRTY